MKTRLIKLAFLLLVVTGISLSSCKKGENDPGISFRSRDGRLAGEWTLSGITGESMYTSSTGSVTQTTKTTISYANNTETTVTTPSIGSPNTATKKYTFSMTLEKDGTLTFKYVAINASGVVTATDEGAGSWFWNNTGKKKTHVTLSFQNTNAESLAGGTWEVNQLKNKELILKAAINTKTSTSSGYSETKGDYSLIFTSN